MADRDSGLAPQLALMVRLIGVLVLLRAWYQLRGVFLPFVGQGGPDTGTDGELAQLLALALAIMLVLNIRLRFSALVLGLLILGQVLASRTYYENNRTFAGCLLVLCGLSTGGRTTLVRAQVVLLYFAAAINKLLDVDWRSGRYMLHFADRSGVLRTLLHNAPLLSASQLAAVICWSAIVIELVLVGGFLVRRLWAPTIWLGLAYHTALVLTTQRTFGMFWYLTAVSYLAFATWSSPVVVDRVRESRVRSLLDAGRDSFAKTPAVPLVAMAVMALPNARWDYAAAAGAFVLLLVVAGIYGPRRVAMART